MSATIGKGINMGMITLLWSQFLLCITYNLVVVSHACSR